MTATAIDDPDLCLMCKNDRAAVLGFCARCLEKATWFLDPPPRDN